MAEVAIPPQYQPISGTTSPTIQIIVVDEKGVKANCKLYRTERLSDILKKYNSRLHTTYDAIMINNSIAPLQQTPAMLGLEDGQIVHFCKLQNPQPTLSFLNSSSTPSASISLTSSNIASSSISSNSASSSSGLSNSTAAVSTNNPAATSTIMTSTVSRMKDPDHGKSVDPHKDLDTANTNIRDLQGKIVTLEGKIYNLEGKLNNLEGKLNEEQEKTTCKICFDRPRDTVIFPCLHFSYCNQCLAGLPKTRDCPSCRGHIAGTLLIQIG